MSIIYCPHCNSQLLSSSRFCSRCGSLVSNVELERLPTKPLHSDYTTLPILDGFAELPHGNVPAAYGTPHIGDVPFVQGTPSAPGGSAAQVIQGGNPAPAQPHAAAPSEAMHIQHHSMRSYHQHHAASPHLENSPTSPLHHSNSGELSSQDHSQHKHHRHSKHLSQHLKRAGRWSPNVFRAILAGAVIITGIVAAFLLLPPRSGHAQPALILNGTIVPGGLLSIHGSNFSSGGTVSLTVDGQPATLASSSLAHPIASSRDTSASLALLANQVTTTVPSTASMTQVKGDGTFDATIQLNPKWSIGSSHVLLANEQSSGQKAQVTFVVPQRPSLASCSNSTDTITRTLGPIDAGQSQPVSATFALCTEGSGMVNWSASWNQKQAAWLQLPQSGHIQAPLSQQLQVGASAVGLQAGAYNTTVTFSSSDSSIKVFLKVELIVRSKNAPVCLNANMQSLSFVANQGTNAPTTKFVAITNCGKTGNWTVSLHTDDGANWLNANPTGGNLTSAASQNVSIGTLSAKLGAGTYTGQVTFTIGSGISGMAAVDVILVVVPSNKPCISAFPSSLSFTIIQNQHSSVPQTTTIGNCGNSGSWSAATTTTDGANWLHISPAQGMLNANATQNVSVSVLSANLLTGTTYSGTITFSMGTSTATVTVSLTIAPQQTGPCITVDNPSISFNSTLGQGDPSAQSVILTNCGPNDSWSGQASASWLSINPATGNLNSGASQSISIAAASANLSANTYTGQITFTSHSGAKKVVTVMWNLMPPVPCIQANPQSLTFMAFQGQNDPPAQSVTLTNCGAATGSWSGTPSTTDGASWLNIKPGNASLNAGTMQNVAVNISSANLSMNTYTGQIVFTMGSSSATVNITLNVAPPPPPCIKLDQTSLSFAGVANVSDPPQQTVTITNCGPSGNWSSTLTEDNGKGWLSVNPSGGPLNSQATQGIAVTASNLSVNLAPGTYTGHITFAIGSSSTTVNVTLTVSHADCINVDQSSLSFSNVQKGTPSQNLALTNCGSTGAWTASVAGTSNGTTWLSTDQSMNTLNAGANQTIVVTVNACDYYGCLSPGSYTGSITFSLGSASKTVTVTFDIPHMQLSSTSLSFGTCPSDSTSQNITITNTGGGTLTWSVGTPTYSYQGTPTPSASWLTVTVTSGSTSDTSNQSSTLTFTIDKTQAGGSNATVVITSTDGETSTVTVMAATCIY